MTIMEGIAELVGPSPILLPAILASSFVTGLVIFFLREEWHGLRTALNLFGAGAKVLLVGILLVGLAHGHRFELRYEFAPGVVFALGADGMSALFLTLSSFLWLVTTLYAVGYLEDSPHRSRFFGFFSVVVTATTGIALSANLVTFLIFYELLTVSTYPLVVHRGTAKTMAAGRVYLSYTVAGGTILLLAVAWLQSLTGPVDFTDGGLPEALVGTHPRTLQVIFALFIIALGVKSALFPLHGWLPRAMVAPAPVSALLHAVAVVKAGAFGIIRLVYDVYGVAMSRELGLLDPLVYVAAITIVFGSVMALFQDELKKRLAYSTVSQVSYVALGIALFGPVATVGGLAHLVHQGIMKITLFFCAGNYAETLGIHKVSEMDGVGRRMPLTTAAFTIGALGMIGLPPLAGYVSKWQLKAGAATAGHDFIVWVLMASSLLNAMYFLPILHRAWLRERREPWPAEHVFPRFETHWMLLAPPVVTAASVIITGVLANSAIGPLAWARLVAAEEYAALGIWAPLAGADNPLSFAFHDVVSSTWPVFLGGALAAIVFRHSGRRSASSRPTSQRLPGENGSTPAKGDRRLEGIRRRAAEATRRAEAFILRFETAGALLLALIGVFVALLMLAG